MKHHSLNLRYSLPGLLVTLMLIYGYHQAWTQNWSQ